MTEEQNDAGENQARGDESASPQGLVLPPAPRKFPEPLSGQLVRAFAMPAIITMLIGLGLAGVGYYLEESTRDLQEQRYYGDYIHGIGYNAMSDEDGEWCDVEYQYKGETRTAQLDITQKEYNTLSAPPGYAEIAIVVWPDAPGEPESVAYIDEQTGVFEFAWAYYAALIVTLIGLLVALKTFFKARSAIVNGVEVWAHPLSAVHYDGDARKFSLRVEYQHNQMDKTAFVQWKNGESPVYSDEEDAVCLLVHPRSGYLVHLLKEGELNKIRAAS